MINEYQELWELLKTKLKAASVHKFYPIGTGPVPTMPCETVSSILTTMIQMEAQVTGKVNE